MSLREQQPDLWDPPRSRPAVKPRRRREFAETSRAAKDRFAANEATIEGRILVAIRAAGRFGITRKELKERLDLEINVICGRVDHLIMTRKLVFEPLRSGILPATPEERRLIPKGMYVQRHRQKIVVAIEYLADWPESKVA